MTECSRRQTQRDNSQKTDGAAEWNDKAYSIQGDVVDLHSIVGVLRVISKAESWTGAG